MCLSNLLDQEEPPQQPVPITRVCWDELFAFLQNLFKPRAARPYVNLDRVTTTKQEYVKVVEWVVANDFKGELEGVTLNCPDSADFDNTHWKLEIAAQEKFKDKYIGTSLTLCFGGCEIQTKQSVVLWGKSVTGVAIKMDGAIYGKEIFLGK